MAPVRSAVSGQCRNCLRCRSPWSRDRPQDRQPPDIAYLLDFTTKRTLNISPVNFAAEVLCTQNKIGHILVIET